MTTLDQWCDSLERDGAAVLCVRGTSMKPFLRDGEIVLVRREPPRAGEIGLVRTDDGLRCHRRLGGRTFKADGRAAPDPPGGRLLGRVEARVREGRFEPVSRWIGLAASIARIPVRLVRR